MRTGMSRRSFLAVSAASVSLCATAGRDAEAAFQTTLRKAVILNKDRMNDETFKKLIESATKKK